MVRPASGQPPADVRRARGLPSPRAADAAEAAPADLAENVRPRHAPNHFLFPLRVALPYRTTAPTASVPPQVLSTSPFAKWLADERARLEPASGRTAGLPRDAPLSGLATATPHPPHGGGGAGPASAQQGPLRMRDPFGALEPARPRGGSLSSAAAAEDRENLSASALNARAAPGAGLPQVPPRRPAARAV